MTEVTPRAISIAMSKTRKPAPKSDHPIRNAAILGAQIGLIVAVVQLSLKFAGC